MDLTSMAMRIPSDLGSLGVGSVQRRKRNENVLTRTRTERKKAVIVSVWLKEGY
jgi:hypothetical protein